MILFSNNHNLVYIYSYTYIVYLILFAFIDTSRTFDIMSGINIPTISLNFRVNTKNFKYRYVS